MSRFIRNLFVAVASFCVCVPSFATEVTQEPSSNHVAKPGTLLTNAAIQQYWDEYLSYWSQQAPYNLLLPVTNQTYVYTNIPDTIAGHVPKEEPRNAKACVGYSAASLAAIQQYFSFPTQYKSATKRCALVQHEMVVDYMTGAFGPREMVSTTPISLTFQSGTYNWAALDNDMAAIVAGNSAVLLQTNFGMEFSSATPELFATALKDLGYAHGYYVACPDDAKLSFLEKAVYAPAASNQPVAIALKNELGETCSVLVTAVGYNSKTKKYACYVQWGDENHYDELNGWYDLSSPLKTVFEDILSLENFPFIPRVTEHTWTLVGATTLIAPPAGKTAVKPSADAIIPVVGRLVDEEKTFSSLAGLTVTCEFGSVTTTAEGVFALTVPANKEIALTVKDKKARVVGAVSVRTGAFPKTTTADFKTELDVLVPAIQEISVVAQADIYTMTFDANGGTGGTAMTLAEGAALTAPTTVTREGYTLKGWKPALPAKVPAKDTTYTAQWKINQYTITFDANGGTGGKTQKLNYGAALTAPSTVTREGYTLMGWLPAVDPTVPAKDTTYTAQWQVNQYTITFDANGGTGGKTQKLNYGAALTAPTVTREGYTFVGWSPAVDATVPAKDTTYKAIWKDVSINFTYAVKKNQATITGCETLKTDSVKIPEIIPHMDKDGQSVTLDVTSIADNAFKGQTGLTQVTIPDSVTSIGKNAFSGCTNLDVNAIKMPNQPKLKVGKGAFTGCKVAEIAAVPGESITGTVAAGYKVATSVSGFKLNAKTGVWTATFKKSGTYEAVLFKSGANLNVVRINVGAMPKVTIEMEGENKGCSVKGAGAYLMGKKVTVSAKASKEKIFLGFYDEQDKLVSSAMKYSFVMGREDVKLIAKFKEEVIDTGISALTSETWRVGQPYTVTLPVKAESGVKSVKAKLPSGLKLSKTKAGVWQVTGSPKKAGDYKVTVTVGTGQKKQKVDEFTMTVKPEETKLELSVVQNATLNVSHGVSNIVIGASATSAIKSVKASKLPSGMKVQCINGVWQLTGTPKKAGTYNVKFTMVTKAGTKVEQTVTLTVNLVPEWAAKSFTGNVIITWEEEDEWVGVSGWADVTVATTGEVKGSVLFEDNATALLSGTAKLLESSTTKVRLQVTVPWFDPDGKADGKVKTELILNNNKGTVTLDYRDFVKDSYVVGTLRTK